MCFIKNIKKKKKMEIQNFQYYSQPYLLIKKYVV